MAYTATKYLISRSLLGDNWRSILERSRQRDLSSQSISPSLWWRRTRVSFQDRLGENNGILLLDLKKMREIGDWNKIWKNETFSLYQKVGPLLASDQVSTLFHFIHHENFLLAYNMEILRMCTLLSHTGFPCGTIDCHASIISRWAK